MIAGIHFQNCWFLTAEKCWFYSTAYTELDQIIQSIRMNMENNYKDNATSGYQQLSEVYTQYMKDGKLSDKQKAYYEPILTDLAKQLEGFTHKEQKAFWYL